MEDWWTRILAGGTLSADEHVRAAGELMAYSERTAQANPERRYGCVTDETERAKAHALIALAKGAAATGPGERR
jgi:hypothetical protein